MCNISKLKGKIAEKGMKQYELAEKIKVNKSTLNRKIKSGENFTLGEAIRISKALSLTKEEAMEIFFNDVVA